MDIKKEITITYKTTETAECGHKAGTNAVIFDAKCFCTLNCAIRYGKEKYNLEYT